MNLAFAPHISFGGLDRPLFAESAKSKDPIDQIRFAADQGFAGIQDPFVALRDASEQSRIGEFVARCGLRNGSFVYAPPQRLTAAWGSTDASTRAEILRDVDTAVEIADRIHASHIAIIGLADPHLPRALQFVAMAENLKYAAERAERAGKVLCIESISAHRLPNVLVHHVLDSYAIVKAAASPAVRIIFDTAHVQAMDGNVTQNLAITWDAIAVIQLADHPGRVEMGAGELNFTTLLTYIARRGYSGLLELEHLWLKPGLDSEQRGLAELRSLDADVSRSLASDGWNVQEKQ